MGILLEHATAFLKEYGYMPQDENPKSFNDIAVTSAVAKFQRFDANVRALKEATGEELLPDGDIGPATAYAMALPRCACPDVLDQEAALGSGGWRECHGIEDAHKAIVSVDQEDMPSFLRPSFREVLKRVQKSYAEIGLLFVFRDESGNDLITGDRVTGRTNIDMVFTRGKGWIGLAIVGNGSNQRCSSKIWAKFDYRYQPRNVVQEWTTLIKHELGHNCGLRHSSGGVMNPSIVNGLPVSWAGDPSHGTLKRWFGGDPVDIPGGDEPEPPRPPKDDKWPGVFEPIGESFMIDDGVKAQLFRVMGG